MVSPVEDMQRSGCEHDRALSVAERCQAKEFGGEFRVCEYVGWQDEIRADVQVAHPDGSKECSVCRIKGREGGGQWLGVLHHLSQNVRIRPSKQDVGRA